MSKKEQEIKKILAGNIAFEGNVIVAGKGSLLIGKQGIPNGWSAMMLAGLCRREYWFDITDKKQEGFEEAAKVLGCLGKRCKLEHFPASEAVIRRNGIFNPQILILEKDEYQLRLTIYTARTITASFACRKTAKAFQNHLPQGIFFIETKR